MAEPRSILQEVDEDAESEAIAKAEADLAAGRTVPHEYVVTWLKSWGTPNEQSCPLPKAK